MVDLHTHSIYSDGTMSPEEILAYAKDIGIKTLAITDHDDIEGSKELIKIRDKDIIVYSGVELSAKVPKGEMHILGYNFDLYNEELNRRLKELRDSSIDTIKLYINQLKTDFNIILPDEDINELLSKKGKIGRPQLALILIKYGYIKNVREAFKEYLNDSKVRNIKKSITKEECVQMITSAGGIASLAHPWTLEMSNEELYNEIEYLKSIGLGAIEVIHSNNTAEQRAYYHYLANEFNLLETGGTDFHGYEVKPEIELGLGINNNVNIDDNTLSLTKKIKTRYR